MNRYLRCLFLIVAVLLVGALLVGCGGEVPPVSGGEDTESDSAASEIPVETRHEHASAGDPIEEVASTCSTRGYKQYRCDGCNARYNVELPLGRHDYVSQYDATLGYEVVKCDGCDDWRMEVDAAGEYGFAADCKGMISVSFDVLGTDAAMDFVVDGVTVKSESFAAGSHTVTLAEGLAAGSHTFSLILKNSGVALDVTDVSVDGSLYRPGALLLELTKAASGKNYGDFFVYVQTSDPSGEYYVRYRFVYSYNTSTSNGSNSATNIESFRVISAELVQVSDISDTAVAYTVISNLLSSGEISLAIKEYDYDPAQEKNVIADFCGGFHGDEHILNVDGELQMFLEADGVSYTPGAEKKVVRCNKVVFEQTTLLDRWAAVAGSAGQFAKHSQIFEITVLGMSIDRTVEWLVDDFIIGDAYPMMYTLHRLDGEKAVCEVVSTYDADGKLIASEVLELHNTEKQKTILQSANLRRVEYSSQVSGISSTASFVLGENNDGVLASPYIAYRTDTAGADNKLYVPMKGSNSVKVSANTESGTVTKSRPSIGDVWEISCFYHIDYVKPVE